MVVPADAQPSPSHEELAGLVAVLADRVGALEAENAELRRRLGMNSGNSPAPPSKDPIAAKAGRKAKRSADRSSRERSPDRKPGGQQGHKGPGLTPATVPDRTERAAAPAQCRGCGADLADPAAGASDAGAAVAPHAQAGSVVYGPNINAAAILLSSEGNVPVERAAALMEALLGTPVSSGFVARALARLAQRLQAAGFDAAMKAALQAEDVLCGDETPANVITRDTDEHGETVPGAPHAVTLRTPDARLIWYAAMGSRSGPAIAGLGVLEDWHGYLVRDDYAAWHQFDAQLAGVQQCAAHLIRHCKGVLELHPQWQARAGQVRDILREAAAAVQAARNDKKTQLDPGLLADLHARYDTAVAWGITTNRLRDWHKGRHPGCNLARRLHDKAEQVWLFTREFRVPWTNNASEQALKGPKRHQAVSGYWHSTTTLADYCRVRSYLVSARGHDIRAIDAIHATLAGKPWLPVPVTA